MCGRRVSGGDGQKNNTEFGTWNTRIDYTRSGDPRYKRTIQPAIGFHKWVEHDVIQRG